MSVNFPADDYVRSRRRSANITPVLIGCAFAAVALAAQSRLGAWLRGFISARVGAADTLRRPIQQIPFPLLRQRILGRSKTAVVTLVGPPRTAVLAGGATAFANPSAFFRADTWYYAIAV
jgi:hypothetical protein